MMGCGSSKDALPLGVGVVPEAKPTSSGSSSSSSDSTCNGSSGKTTEAAVSSPKVESGNTAASSASSAAATGVPRARRFGPPIPISVLTDSYKASHFLMYPEAKRMVAYGEFRAPYNKDESDSRFVYYGIRYIIENFVAVQWTEEDVELADKFYSTHNAGFQPYPFPKDLFLKFVRENNGYFPVRIESLLEGTVANVHVPVYQIFAEGEYSRLITFLETILTQVWYPSTVATLSRRTRDLIETAFDDTVDPEGEFTFSQSKMNVCDRL